MIWSFTGHRPDKLGGYRTFQAGVGLGESPLQSAIRTCILRLMADMTPDMVISGMALGIDQMVAELAIETGTPFTAALPFVGQEGKWPAEAQAHYQKLLASAHKIQYCSEPGYAPYKMQVRNQWMVDNSDLLIAVWDGSTGGTHNCVKYAERVGKPVVRINPKLLVF